MDNLTLRHRLSLTLNYFRNNVSNHSGFGRLIYYDKHKNKYFEIKEQLSERYNADGQPNSRT